MTAVLNGRGLRRMVCTGAAAIVCSGCLPHVMHGPRVEDDGLSGSLSLTVGRNREIGTLETAIVPSLYGGVRRSWVASDGDGPAASFGVQVPVLIAPFLAEEESGETADILLATSYADAYVQPMRSSEPGLEWGVGVLASTALVGPYLQVGRIAADGGGWYTTELVAFSIGDKLAEGVLYMPTVVRRSQAGDDSSAGNFSAGMGFGFNDNGGTDMLITLGVTIELGLGR